MISISTRLLKTCMNCVMSLAMTFIFVSVAWAQPSGQTQALYFNHTTGSMRLWSGSVDNHNVANSFLGPAPSAATTVATTANYSGSYSWNGGTRTLTLTNFKYSTSHPYALYVDAPGIIIELVGENTLTSTYKGGYISAGLYIRTPSQPENTRTAYIKGTGTLTALGGDVTGDRSTGIYSFWGLTINDGTTNAYGGTGLISNGMFVWDWLTITSGVINAHGGPSNGIGARGESTGISAELGLVMTGGKIYADAMDANAFSSGFWSYEGPIKITGGVFISRGYKGAVYADHKASPPGSNIIFPSDGYVAWHNTNYNYEPVESEQINALTYRHTLNDRYVKFINYGIDDVEAQIWWEGEAIDLTLTPPKPIVNSGGRTVTEVPGWQISNDGVSGWTNLTPLPATASMDLNGKYIRYTVTIGGNIGEVSSNEVQKAKITVIPVFPLTVSAGANGTVSGKAISDRYPAGQVITVAAGGTITGNYPAGTEINLTPTPAANYIFANWNPVTGITISNIANPAKFTMPATAATLTANFTSKIHKITVIADPSAGSDVTGGGEYEHGQSVTVTATPNAGYTFVGWYENGTLITGATVSYSFGADRDRTLVAKFELSIYTITVSANPTTGGTVAGGGRYTHGTSVTVTAIPKVAEGYEFINWTEGGIPVVGAEASYTFSATGNRNLVANFKLKTYTVKAFPNNGDYGYVEAVDGFEEFEIDDDDKSGYIETNVVHGSIRTLKAVTKDPTNNEFVNWTDASGKIRSTNEAYTFIVMEDNDLTANFKPKERHFVNIVINPEKSGTATGGGDYAHGTVNVPVTATPEEGWKFEKWTTITGGLLGNATTYTIPVIDKDITLVANFTPIDYTITVSANPPAGGAVAGGGIYPYGKTATVTATPNEGYNFVGWYENGAKISDVDATYIFTVTGNRTLVAHFEKIKYKVTVKVNNDDYGSITTSPVIVENIPTEFDYGTKITVRATPEDDYFDFVNWTDDKGTIVSTATYTFEVTKDVVLTANFRFKEWFIATIVTNPAGGGITTGNGYYFEDEEVTVTAVPFTGYVFAGWTKNGVVVSTNPSDPANTYTFNITEDVTLVANFTPINYNVSVYANPTAGGSVTGGGTYSYRKTVTVTATPKDGYELINWTKETKDGVAVVSTTDSYTFTVIEDVVLIANFALKKYMITTIANPTTNGTVTPGGTYTYGTSVAVTATSTRVGYEFMNWTESGTVVSTSATYRFTVESSRTLVANFAKKTYYLSAQPNPPYEYGSIEPAVGFEEFIHNSFGFIYYSETNIAHGDERTLTAVPTGSHLFVNWTDASGTIVSTNEEYTFDVTENTNLLANFKEVGTYLVNIVKYPANSGRVVRTGETSEREYVLYYSYPINLSAIANDGYKFKNWTIDGSVVETDLEYIVDGIVDNIILVANFELETYTITSSISAGKGTITPRGNVPVEHGGEKTFEFAPADGYRIDKVLVNNVNNPQAVSSGVYTFLNVTGNRSIVVSFVQNIYTVAVNADPSEGGAVSGGGRYLHGADVIIAATPKDGYEFAGWIKDNGEKVSTTSHTYIAAEDAKWIAKFTKKTYDLTVGVNNGAYGSASGSATTIPYGTVRTVTATANEGYVFVNWVEANGAVVSTTEEYTFAVKKNTNLTANFKPDDANSVFVTVVIEPAGTGTTTGSGVYTRGQNVPITASNNTGYSFVNWTIEGEGIISSTSTHTLPNIREDVVVVAHFTPASNYTVSLSANPSAGGTVDGGGSGILHGVFRTVTATPNAGYRFVNWTEGGTPVSDDANYRLTVTGNRTLVANFIPKNYTVTVKENNSAYGSASGAATNIPYGTVRTVTATASGTNVFVNWTNADGMEVSTSATYNITVTEDIELTANFRLAVYNWRVTIEIDPAGVGAGTATGAGYYMDGETVTIAATAHTGYEFINWTGGTGIVTTAIYHFTIDRNLDWTANFKVKTYNIKGEPNPSAGGTVSGGGSNIPHGTSVTLTANPATGYEFVNWTKDGVQFSTDAEYQFTAIEDITLMANFRLQTYNISVSAKPTAGGTVTGGGTYRHGEKVEITATPKDGSWKFIGWTVGVSSEKFSDKAVDDFTATKDIVLVANFVTNIHTITASISSGRGIIQPEGSFFSVTHGSELTFDINPEPADATVYHVEAVTVDGLPVSVPANGGSYAFRNITDDHDLVVSFALNIYTISVYAEPSGGGTVTGGGRYLHGADVTVTAIANKGYEFVEWIDVADEENYVFTATSNKTLVAKFEPLTYTVKAKVNNTEWGEIKTGGDLTVGLTGSAEGVFDCGTEITVEAVVKTGHKFVNWTDASGKIVSREEDYTFVVTDDIELTANFTSDGAAAMLLASIVVNPSGAGQVTGGGYYSGGDEVTVKVITPNEGYYFVNWTDGRDNNEIETLTEHHFTITEDVVLKANFAFNEYDITATAGTGGTAEGSRKAKHGERVTISAAPGAGYKFVKWTEDGIDVSADANYSFIALRNRTLVANFERKTYTVTVKSNDVLYGTALVGTMGDVNYGKITDVEHGTSITIEATEKSPDLFMKWVDADGDKIGEKTSTFTVTKDRDLTAYFKPDDSDDWLFVNIAIDPSGTGTATGVGPYQENDDVIVTATAETGYEFEKWTDSQGQRIETKPETVHRFAMPDEDVSLTAHFDLKTYSITLLANPEDGGTALGSADGSLYSTSLEDILHGTAVTIKATPKEGWEFVNWTSRAGTAQFSTEAEYTFTAIENISLMANFRQKYYQVTFRVVGVIGGDDALDATFDGVTYKSRTLLSAVVHGTNIVFTAHPPEGYCVKEWTYNGAPVSDNKTNEFVIDALSESARVTVEFVNDNTGIEIGVDPDDPDNPDKITVEPDPDGEDGFSYIAFAPCGDESVEVTVTPKGENARVFIDGVECTSRVVNLPIYGNNPITILVIAESGREQTYTLKINKLVPFWDLVVMQWNNTLSVINNPENNPAPGFTFVEYRWFRNDELQPFSRNQWWSAGDEGETLSTTHLFVAEGKTADKNILRTCPSRITLKSLTVKALPNPVAPGQTLYIEADVEEELLRGAVIEVYNLLGNRIDYLTVQGRLTPVNVRYASGFYVFVLKGRDGLTKELKVVVE